MVPVHDLARLFQIDWILLLHLPLQRRDEIEIIIQRIVLRSVRRLLFEAAEHALHLLPDVIRHAGSLDPLLEGVLILLPFRLHFLQLFLEQVHLLFDGRLLVGDPLRIIRALKIDLKVNGTLEPLDRLENQLPAFPEGSCLQQLILLLRRHVEELAEDRRVFVHRLEVLQVFDRIVSALDLRRHLRGRLLQCIEQRFLSDVGDIHHFLNRFKRALQHIRSGFDRQRPHLAACPGVEKRPHRSFTDIQNLRLDTQRVEVIRCQLFALLRFLQRHQHHMSVIYLDPAFFRLGNFLKAQAILHIRQKNRIVKCKDHTACTHVLPPVLLAL